MRISNRYTSFFKQASTYDSEWGNFEGLVHTIPEDDNNKPPSDQPRQSHDIPRSHMTIQSKVHSIPLHNKDFEPVKTIPIPSDFKNNGTNNT